MCYPSVFLNATSFPWKCHRGCPDWVLPWLERPGSHTANLRPPDHRAHLCLVCAQVLPCARAEAKPCASPGGCSASSGVTQSLRKTACHKTPKGSAGKCAVLSESLGSGSIPASKTSSFRSYYAIFQSVCKNVDFCMKKEKERYFAGCLFHDLYLKYSALAVLPREQEPSLQRKLGCVVRARGHHEGREPPCGAERRS